MTVFEIDLYLISDTKLLILGFAKDMIGNQKLSKNITKEKQDIEARHALVGPADIWESKRAFQFNFLIDRLLKKDHYLLDIGCGTLRGGIPLIEYLDKGHYFGIEARDYVLNEGKKELSEAGLELKQPTLLHSPDIAQLNFDFKFDYIWSFAVLIHMTDEILDDTLKLVSEYLSDSGVMYANVNIGTSRTGNWQEFPVMWRPLSFYEDVCVRNGLTVKSLGSLKQFGHVVIGDQSQEDKIMLQIKKKV